MITWLNKPRRRPSAYDHELVRPSIPVNVLPNAYQRPSRLFVFKTYFQMSYLNFAVWLLPSKISQTRSHLDNHFIVEMADKINTRFHLFDLESAPSLEGFVAMPDHNIAIRKIRALENEQKRKKSCLPAATGKIYGRQEYLASVVPSDFLWQV